MSNSVNVLPHWDMSVVYPSIDSVEFEEDFRSVIRSVDELADMFDRFEIGQRPQAALDETAIGAFETAVQRLNAVLARATTVRAYIWSFVSTESQNERAQAKLSEFQQQAVRLSVLNTRLIAWIGSLDVEALIARSEIAAAHAFMLRKARERAGHLLSPAEEELVAELSLTGGTAWAKLYNTFTSQLLVPIELDGVARELPMTAIRNLAYDSNRDVRRRAYQAELAAWQRAAVPIAAALNSIKGEMNTLSRRRSWESALDSALFENNIDRQTLDAMLEAAREAFPDFRRYLRAKARALGLPALAWYDLFAPVGATARAWLFESAAEFISSQFGSYSLKLKGLADRAFNEHWIDAEPRVGKRGGAFCMLVRGGESRILSNYQPAFGQVRTLAHELGHAYHNQNLADRTMLQRGTPMTLAETASTFCETIVHRAALQAVDAQEQLMILEASLQDACQVVVDITSRFLFEQQVFDSRRKRELSTDEFCVLMLDAQRQTYGDGLDSDQLHPFMWAVKPHYYSSTFYNFPYMFGLLFGLGLYARYRQDAEQFKSGYDDLLSSTGMADAANLAARFGIDIRSRDFWRSSLDVVRADIDRFEALVGEQSAG